MTRFIMSLEEAVDLVLFAFEHGRNGDILVQKAKNERADLMRKMYLETLQASNNVDEAHNQYKLMELALQDAEANLHDVKLAAGGHQVHAHARARYAEGGGHDPYRGGRGRQLL